METVESFGQPLIILNPVANRGHMQPYRAVIRSRVEQEQAEYVETTCQGEAQERAMQAAQRGRPVVVVGGDGTVHEAVNGLLASGRRVPLGIVGAGSGNDFAWNALKLPHEPAEALERALHGRLIAVDAGMVNGRYFANAFSVGLDADIGAAATTLKKYPLMSGERLYYIASLRQLIFGYQRCPWLTCTVDGVNVLAGETGETGKIERHCVLLAVSNGPTYGAGFRINPSADYADGLFDICQIDYVPLIRALQLLPRVQHGEHTYLPMVHFHRGSRVTIESRQPLHIQMDGEISRSSHFEGHMLPGALLVRV